MLLYSVCNMYVAPVKMCNKIPSNPKQNGFENKKELL